LFSFLGRKETRREKKEGEGKRKEEEG